MKPLVCGTCTACCRWSGNADVLRPSLLESEAGKYKSALVDGVLRLEATQAGDCVYLGHRGCTIHPTRPQFCREFDCRQAYDAVIKSSQDHTLLSVLVAGGIRTEKIS